MLIPPPERGRVASRVAASRVGVGDADGKTPTRLAFARLPSPFQGEG